MDKNEFHSLLKRYLNGRCSDAERGLVDQLYELLDDRTLPVSAEEEALVEERLWNRLAQGMEEDRVYPLRAAPVIPADEVPQPLYKRLYSRAGLRVAGLLVAASFVGLVLIKGWFGIGHIYPTEASVFQRPGFRHFTNHTSHPELLTLEEGSTISVGPGATLSYPPHFDRSPGKGRREVYLEGDAFFTVANDPQHPFCVHNGSLVTQVLGTSFGVCMHNNQIVVKVSTGRVSVSEDEKKGNGVIVTPNQQVTYYRSDRHFITGLIDNPQPLSTALPASGKKDLPPASFRFDETPVSHVLKQLEETYGIKIYLENEQLNDCPFTGDIAAQDLFNKLELICQALQATYEIKGTVILIKGGVTCHPS